MAKPGIDGAFQGGENIKRLRVMIGSMGDRQIMATRVMQGSITELVTLPGTTWSTAWNRTAGSFTAELQLSPDGTLEYEFGDHSGICMIGDGSGNATVMTMDHVDRFSMVSSGTHGSTAVFKQAKLHAHN